MATDLANGDGDWMDVANLALTAVSGVSASRGGCFPAGTPVLTYEGLKRIEYVQRGEAVWAFDLRDSQWKLRDVVETFEQDFSGELVTITVAGERIQTTDHHPVYVIEGFDLANRPRREHIPPDPHATTPGRWVDAIDLRIGDGSGKGDILLLWVFAGSAAWVQGGFGAGSQWAEPLFVVSWAT